LTGWLAFLTPACVTNINKHWYFFTFMDAATHHTMVYFSKQKSDAPKFVQAYKAFLFTQTGKRMKVLRVDNRKEYINSDLQDYLQQEGIHLETTAPHLSF
jgi:hypothetical protein